MKPVHYLVALRGRKDCQAAILVTTLLLVALISMLTAATLYRVSSRYSSSYQSAAWNEALTSAEGGADLALLALNKSIASPATAWTGWTPSDATTFPKTYVPTIASHSGQGNNKVYAKITVDKGVGSGWMRVRSTGVAELPAQARNGLEAAVYDTTGLKNHRSMLRKTSSVTDQTGGLLRLPQVARTIEVLAAPGGSFPYVRSLTVKNTIAMSGGAYTDSFDSSNPAYSNSSLPGGYDATKRLSHGDVATNANGSLSDLKSTYVYGDASSNGGTIANTANVQGTVTNNFQTTIPDISDPSFPSVAATPTVISGGMTLTGGSASSPAYYKVSSLTISNGASPLILAPSAPGVESYINIWVTGKTTISGSGYIQQQPNVHVTFYCDSDVTVSGGGIMNQTNTASYLQVFGVTPSSGTPKMTVSGSGSFIGVLNAPAFAITISGSASFIGAAIGSSVNISGSGGFHYDQQLSSLSGPGAPASYTYSSWVEDIR